MVSAELQLNQSLIQVKAVTVCRDYKQDFKRTGDRLDTGHFGINQHWGYDYDHNFKRPLDKVDTGLFGVNQHWGYDFPVNDIKNASAGCLVGRRRQGHKEFMTIVKSDRRYQLNKNYIFVTTVIAGDGLTRFR